MQPGAPVSLSKSLFLPSFHSSTNDLPTTRLVPCMVLSAGETHVDTIDKLRCPGAHLPVVGGVDTHQTSKYTVQLPIVIRTVEKKVRGLRGASLKF